MLAFNAGQRPHDGRRNCALGAVAEVLIGEVIDWIVGDRMALVAVGERSESR
jgi:hypothetical protein